MEVVKVQKSFSGESFLVYAEGHKKAREYASHNFPQSVKDAMGEDMKAFFNAEYTYMLSGWKIHDRVEDPGW